MNQGVRPLHQLPGPAGWGGFVARREVEPGCCYYCFVPLALTGKTRDHVRPRSQGGGGARNVRPACPLCNALKADHSEDLFRRTLALIAVDRVDPSSVAEVRSVIVAGGIDNWKLLRRRLLINRRRLLINRFSARADEACRACGGLRYSYKKGGTWRACLGCR